MSKHIVACSGVKPRGSEHIGGTAALEIEYKNGVTGRNISLPLPDFIRDIYHLPDRYIDLLEIAAYVFSADRLIPRGRSEAVEFQSWARNIEFHVPVRDVEFWSRPDVCEVLCEALLFMSGDAEIRFCFSESRDRTCENLFSGGEFKLPQSEARVILFSGGLDSFAGTLEVLESTREDVCLVSHQASHRLKRTQKALVDALKRRYPERLVHYVFPLNLHGIRAPEETQRTRGFLFCSVALALAHALDRSCIYVYENGITSLNYSRREDLLNARASRTTHPKTLALLSELFELLTGAALSVLNPFAHSTKADVVARILDSRSADLITSTVSCTKTFRDLGVATHCGTCFQCVDRRIAAYASGAEHLDTAALYSTDIVRESIEGREEKTVLVDYIRQAKEFSEITAETLLGSRLVETMHAVDLPSRRTDQMEAVDEIVRLLRRHGAQVRTGLLSMRATHDDIYSPAPPGSIVGLLSTREYLQDHVERLSAAIEEILVGAVPHMFRVHRPADEPDLNEKVNALLRGHRADLRSEHPEASFACAGFIPDHTLTTTDLLIESKYVRGSTTPSKATEAIGSDLSKKRTDAFILFLVYDPEHRIPDDRVFARDIESRGSCSVCIAR